jgi:transcriptional regulator GlxA family with amidase domain
VRDKECVINIGIYVYDQAEVLDFSGPFEVFSTASRICADSDPFRVFLIGESAGVVHARAGYRVLTDYGIGDHPPLDVLIIAGGVHQEEMHKPEVINWIAAVASQAGLVASVCTGVFLLAQAGVVATQKVTTHWQDIAELRALFPTLVVVDEVRWVDSGDRVTSAGISAGIDMSLHLVHRLHSEDLANHTARQMDFDWRQNG